MGRFVRLLVSAHEIPWLYWVFDSLGARHLRPRLKRLLSKPPIVRCTQQMPSHSEQVMALPLYCEETLPISDRSKSAHLTPLRARVFG